MRGDVDEDEDQDDPLPEGDEPVLLGPDGRPATPAKSSACPRCGAGPKARLAVGFGRRGHEVCQACGFEFR